MSHISILFAGTVSDPGVLAYLLAEWQKLLKLSGIKI